jgi:hypothetical protein
MPNGTTSEDAGSSNLDLLRLAIEIEIKLKHIHLYLATSRWSIWSAATSRPSRTTSTVETEILVNHV